MADDHDENEDPASRRARLKALRRGRKHGPRLMAVHGKSIFLIKRLVDARARAARTRSKGDKA